MILNTKLYFNNPYAINIYLFISIFTHLQVCKALSTRQPLIQMEKQLE